MKKSIKLLSFLLVICSILSLFTACGEKKNDGNKAPEVVDYAVSVTLDMTSSTAKQEVTVKSFIDGDTTHFNVPSSIRDTGILKGRYLAINTPESTGKIEEWGKKASKFTRAKLESATSIIIESDSDKWELDSTGDRHLVWVWYKSADSEQYRNLNIEILQNGLAIASNSGGNRYGETCLKAINQAKTQKLNVYSGEKDPDYAYGAAVELTLKELRCNIEAYEGQKVAFSGIIAFDNDNTLQIESYDEETGIYFGMPVYYGFDLNPYAAEILRIGNEVRIVGTVQYYENGDSYQVSGISYNPMKPNAPDNIQKISEGHSPAFHEPDIDTLVNGKIKVVLNDEAKEFDFATLSLASSVQMNDLVVKSVYTHTTEASNGKLSITCEKNGVTLKVHTDVLTDENGNLITADAFEGKTINVKGIVDRFSGEYQIKVISMKYITIQ